MFGEQGGHISFGYPTKIFMTPLLCSVWHVTWGSILLENPPICPISIIHPCSPDPNPTDFRIWSILESKVGVKKYNSIVSLKRALKAVWNSVEPETVRKCRADARRRFEAGIEAEGGYFEKKGWWVFSIDICNELLLS